MSSECNAGASRVQKEMDSDSAEAAGGLEMPSKWSSAMSSHAHDVVPNVEGNVLPMPNLEDNNGQRDSDAPADGGTWPRLMGDVWAFVSLFAGHVAKWCTAVYQPLGFVFFGVSMILGIVALVRIGHLETAVSEVANMAAAKTCVTICPDAPQSIVIAAVTSTATKTITSVAVRYKTIIATECVSAVLTSTFRTTNQYT